MLIFRLNEPRTHRIFGGDLAVQVSPRDGGRERMNKQSRDYPFWTWFLPNPLPPPRPHDS